MYSNDEKVNITWGDLEEVLNLGDYPEKILSTIEEIHLRNEAIDSFDNKVS